MNEQIETVKFTGQPLGALLYYSPDSPQLTELIKILKQNDIIKEWPYGSEKELGAVQKLIHEGLSDSEEMLSSYRELFVGPGHFTAPAWGSVYLDRESVIFGDSTLRLRQWYREAGVETIMEQNEPEDHIGLMLMCASWLASKSDSLMKTYLAEHLLPWSDRYFELLFINAKSPFYRGVAKLSLITTEGWKTGLSIDVKKFRLYF